MGIENAHQLIVFKIGPLSQLNRAFDSGIHGPELRAAGIEEIADLLAASGLQNSKATRIRQLLRNLCDENSGGSRMQNIALVLYCKIKIFYQDELRPATEKCMNDLAKKQARRRSNS